MSFWPAFGHAARENTSKNAVFGRVIGLLLAARPRIAAPLQRGVAPAGGVARRRALGRLFRGLKNERSPTNPSAI